MRLKISNSKRLKIASRFSISLIIIGILAYIYSPENISNLGIYMLSVVIPIVGYIMGESLKPTRSDDLEP